MFLRQFKEYQSYIPTYTTNALNEKVLTYEAGKVIKAAIALDTTTEYQGNDYDEVNRRFIGITKEREIKRDWKVGDYLVMYSEEQPRFNILYLKKVGIQ